MLDSVVVLGTNLVKLLEEIISPICGVLLRLMQSEQVVGWDYVVVIGGLYPSE